MRFLSDIFQNVAIRFAGPIEALSLRVASYIILLFKLDGNNF